MINKHTKMLWVNRKVKKYLFENKILEWIWLKPHGKFDSDITINEAKFDGIGLSDGEVFFIQIKSNAFPKLEPYLEVAKKRGIKSLLIKYNDGGKIEIKYVP